jgi:hypothetical protein
MPQVETLELLSCFFCGWGLQHQPCCFQLIGMYVLIATAAGTGCCGLRLHSFKGAGLQPALYKIGSDHAALKVALLFPACAVTTGAGAGTAGRAHTSSSRCRPAASRLQRMTLIMLS